MLMKKMSGWQLRLRWRAGAWHRIMRLAMAAHYFSMTDGRRKEHRSAASAIRTNLLIINAQCEKSCRAWLYPRRSRPCLFIGMLARGGQLRQPGSGPRARQQPPRIHLTHGMLVIGGICLILFFIVETIVLHLRFYYEWEDDHAFPGLESMQQYVYLRSKGRKLTMPSVARLSRSDFWLLKWLWHTRSRHTIYPTLTTPNT